MPAALVTYISTKFSKLLRMFLSVLMPPMLPLSSRSGKRWVEISPYGFVSRNYIDYLAGKAARNASSSLSDGSTVVNFKDGSVLVEAKTGHIVELDRQRRVILVRVTKSEAEGAKLTLGSADLSGSFRSAVNESGWSVIVMPGNIVILQGGEQVTIVFPNGTRFFAKKVPALG